MQKLSEKVHNVLELMYEIEDALDALKKDESKKDIFKPIVFGTDFHHLLTNIGSEVVMMEKLEVRLKNHNL